eukprot:Polyplicarium_translucidae@DN1794_c0_g1_i2.p1
MAWPTSTWRAICSKRWWGGVHESVLGHSTSGRQTIDPKSCVLHARSFSLVYDTANPRPARCLGTSLRVCHAEPIRVEGIKYEVVFSEEETVQEQHEERDYGQQPPLISIGFERHFRNHCQHDHQKEKGTSLCMHNCAERYY